MDLRISILSSRAIIALALLLSCYVHTNDGFLDPMGRCEPIDIDICSHLKYNMTLMPNSLGHATQQEAIAELRPYSQLVNFFNCSTHINFLLCSLFAPMCTMQMDGPLVINVCRSMCLQVKSDCEPVLAQLKVPHAWPLNCSQLPERSGKDQICMAPEEVWSAPTPTSATPSKPVIPITEPPTEAVTKSPPALANTCPAKYVKYENLSCTDPCNPTCRDCVPTCDDVFYTSQHKDFATVWMAIWASLCIISTLFTIVSFCVDPGRFRYPTRPVFFMAFCYLMYAMAYFIPLFIHNTDIICKPDAEGGPSLMIVNGMESTLCIVIFLIQYYFGIASHIWWLILTLTWYLAASRKWGLEAINSIACYFHLFAWAVPAVLTIAILVTGRVDSNELTGMCYVGNHDKWSLLFYIIIPMCFLLLIGQIFLLAGFASLLRIRTNLKTQVDNSNIRKLEKLMAKIGVFAILYTVPAVCVVGSHVHEFINMDTWRCMSGTYPYQPDGILNNSIPKVEIHMLKIFMSLIIGISISMWVLSAKTIKSCEKRCCSKNIDSRAAYHQRQYRKQSSYIVAKPMDGNGYIQHYKFPARHNMVMSNHTRLSPMEAANL